MFLYASLGGSHDSPRRAALGPGGNTRRGRTTTTVIAASSSEADALYAMREDLPSALAAAAFWAQRLAKNSRISSSLEAGQGVLLAGGPRAGGGAACQIRAGYRGRAPRCCRAAESAGWPLLDGGEHGWNGRGLRPACRTPLPGAHQGVAREGVGHRCRLSRWERGSGAGPLVRRVPGLSAAVMRRRSNISAFAEVLAYQYSVACLPGRDLFGHGPGVTTHGASSRQRSRRLFSLTGSGRARVQEASRSASAPPALTPVPHEQVTDRSGNGFWRCPDCGPEERSGVRPLLRSRGPDRRVWACLLPGYGS